MKIKELIQDRQDKRQNKTLEANPTFAPTHNRLLHLIKCYWNSKYGENPYDSRSFRKPFFNVVRVPTYVGAKATDLDTKNIKIISDVGQDYNKAYIFNKELKFYFKESRFDLVLNKITYNRPKIGYVLLKKIKKEIFFVQPENDFSDPTEEGISNPMVERHEENFGKIEEYDWDNKTAVIELYKKAGKDKVLFWEISGKVDDDNYKYRVVAGLEYGNLIYLTYSNTEAKYKKLDWETVEGRHAGRGVPEEQFEAQIAANENEYLFRLGLQWTSKHLFQSKDINAARNLLLEALNGDVLPVIQPIEPIAMEERNLGAFQYADTKWLRQSQNQSFSTDVMAGQRPPSGTPATTSVLQAQQAGGYYNLKLQDYGIFIRGVIEDWILPDFKSENQKAHKVHLMKLLGNDTGSSVYFNVILGTEVNRKVNELMLKGKTYLAPQELALIKAITAEELKNKDVDIPDDFYDFKYSVDVVVTGEQIDLVQRANALQVAFQVIGSNPAVLRDPIVRRTYFKLLESTGINPAELFEETVADLPQVAQEIAGKGGSIARPAPASPMPQMANTQVRA